VVSLNFIPPKLFLDTGNVVVGFDNENNYYTPVLKRQRRAMLEEYPNFHIIKGDLSHKEDIEKCFNVYIDKVCHLGAQVGVRYSLENPDTYLQSNIT
jgi:UDP-glucuronate 4-epimerase